MTDRTNNRAESTTDTAVYGFQPKLSDEQWGLVADLFSHGRPGPKGGRPKVDLRAGILWLLRSGARWKDMPSWFPLFHHLLATFRPVDREGYFG